MVYLLIFSSLSIMSSSCSPQNSSAFAVMLTSIESGVVEFITSLSCSVNAVCCIESVSFTGRVASICTSKVPRVGERALPLPETGSVPVIGMLAPARIWLKGISAVICTGVEIVLRNCMGLL